MKIMIIGSGGSGKTTLAKQLSVKLGIPVYHLDAYFWLPNWQEADPDEFMEKHYKLVMQKEWIMDGNYMRTISSRMFAADVIIFLDIPRWRCLYNAIKRQWQSYAKDRADVQVDCPAKFDRKFFGFLCYIWNFKYKQRPYLLGYLKIAHESAKIYHLKSYRDTMNLLELKQL